MKNLKKRKMLAAKVLGVGIGKIVFESDNNADIKEAITKQDIRDLYEAGIIRIKEKRGRRTKEKRKTRRGPGKIKFVIHHRKGDYVKLTRKFRRYIKELSKQGTIDEEKYKSLRKMIKARAFKDKAHIKDHIVEMNKK